MRIPIQDSFTPVWGGGGLRMTLWGCVLMVFSVKNLVGLNATLRAILREDLRHY